MALTISAAASLWGPAGTYLNTASFGLPPRPAWDALQSALDDWRTGRTSWEQWGDETEAARESFARIVGVPPSTVAVGATVSGLVGLVASSLPEGTHVLAPDVEFTSTLFPFLVQAHRGLTVRTVPAVELAAAIDDSTDVVAFSAVQMATGEVADLAAIVAAAKAHGALTLVDATQACGWLPLEGYGFDVLVVAGYKWLLSPRGTAYMSVGPERLAGIVPAAAGWHGWVGAAPALALLEEIGISEIHGHDLGLANRFRAGLGLEPGDSAIVF